jgi:hypothetical protein
MLEIRQFADMENIKQYVDFYSTFGDPIIYNNIKIYPVLAKDYYDFLGIVDILKIEKNKSASIEIIQMSYLYYLIHLMLYNEGVKDAFLTLLNLSLHMELEQDKVNKDFAENDILLQKLPNGVDYYINGWDIEIQIRKNHATLLIMGNPISASEFEDFRRIILFQNLHDFDEIEMNMSDDFRKVVEKYYELKNRGVHHPTLEEKALAIISHTAYTLDTVKLLPMRSFDNLFNTIVAETDYIATKALEPHMKKGSSIDHWIYKPKRQKYMEVFQDAETVAKKVTSM